MEFDGSKHLILKEDDIVGILETDDVKDLQPLNDRVLIKVCHLPSPSLPPLFAIFLIFHSQLFAYFCFNFPFWF